MYISFDMTIAFFFVILAVKHLVIGICPHRAYLVKMLEVYTEKMRKYSKQDDTEHVISAISHHFFYLLFAGVYGTIAWYLW